MNRSRRWSRRLALAGLCGLLVVTGCASDPADEGPGSSSDDVCADVDTARTSLDALLGTEIAQEGTDTFKQRLATFESDVAAVAESGQGELEQQTTAVEDSIATLQDVLGGLKDEPTTADLALVKPALQDLRTSAEDLVAAAGSIC
jgi:hypothetical protein